MNRRLYALHRWISAVALLQLLIWLVSGLFFAAMPMARVKGTPVEGANTSALASGASFAPPSVVLQRLARKGEVTRIELAGTPSGVFYRGKVGTTRFRLDASTGEDAPVDEREAREIARRDQPASPPVRDARRIEDGAPVEYRDRPLPAWRVALADEAGTVVYVDAITGEVTARRNDVWRIYDFLWSLHIMDYRERESFHQPLLLVAASLGLLTVLSGTVLWATRALRWTRRKGARNA